jgi:hypothetical protein
MRVILKTILTSEAELVFIAAQFLELEPMIDRIVIIDPGFTHTGVKKVRIGVDRLLAVLPTLSPKLDYIPLPMTKDVIPCAVKEADCHINERITRGGFSQFMDLSVNDVVISTDADEVLYSVAVANAIERISSRLISWRAETFTLRQFLYKDILIAPGFKFSGPSIVGAGRYAAFKGPFDWRYAGKKMEDYAGCHFSWCMPEASLETKVRNFAHAPSYLKSGVDPRDRKRADIQNKIYSFRSPPIALREIEPDQKLWPRGYVLAKALFAAEIQNSGT